MSGIPRKRASLSCSECNRRKVKCDKVIPCGRCVESGLTASCSRSGHSRHESIPVSGPSSVGQHLDAANNVQDTVAQEKVIDRPNNQPAINETTEQDEIVNAATILEFLAWGKRKEVSYTTELSLYVDEQPADCNDAVSSAIDDVFALSPVDSHRDVTAIQMLQILLPDQAKVKAMVEYHIECLLWYHGSFHGPTFQRRLDEFYGCHHGHLSDPGVNLQWMALLFSVLTGSISCGNKADVLSWGFGEGEQELLSRRWLQATVTCLNAAEYMANLSILSCEAIATLTTSAHILGFSNQQAILLASAVRIAQSLGLHRLNDNKPKTIERETGKRVWAQLCSQDWFSIPFSDSYLVNPLYSTAAAPINCDDYSLNEVHDTIPTVTSYCRYLHSIAALMPGLQDGITRCNTLFTKYEQVMTYDRKMRSIASEQRPVFFANVPLDPSWPRWVAWARRAAAISSSHKIIMIHRNFLVPSFTNPAFDFTRRTCIAASRTILKEVSRVNSENEPVLWIFHAFTVAAGVTLGLDALHRQTVDPVRLEHCRLVESAIDQLRNTHNSKIASRGVKVLTDILQFEIRLRNHNKRKADDISGGSTQQGIDIRNVVKDVQRRTSPQAARSKQRHLVDDQTTDQTTAPQYEVSLMATNQEFAYAESSLPGQWNDFQRNGMLQMADDALANFQSNYNFSQSTDAFGSLLNLAQTEPY